jgi:hypothetical protein
MQMSAAPMSADIQPNSFVFIASSFAWFETRCAACHASANAGLSPMKIFAATVRNFSVKWRCLARRARRQSGPVTARGGASPTTSAVCAGAA